jgi:hypothetical protein
MPVPGSGDGLQTARFVVDSAGQAHVIAAVSCRITPSGGESYHALFVSCTTGFRGEIGLERGVYVRGMYRRSSTTPG